MQRLAVVAAGMLAAFAFGIGVGLNLRRSSVTLVPAPSSPAPELPSDTSARAGLAPGESPGRPSEKITPLLAGDPSSFVLWPKNEAEAQEVLDREPSTEPAAPPAPSLPAPLGLLLVAGRSTEAVITPLNVRDAAALVMGPSTPAPRKPKQHKAPEPDVPDSVRRRFQDPH